MQRVSEEELLRVIRAELVKIGSVRHAATQWDISHQYLYDVLRHARRPGAKLLQAFGYRKEIRYIKE
jgi:hypothetical protein